MAEATSPPLDIDVVVDLHTNTANSEVLINENSSTSEVGMNFKHPILFSSTDESETDDFPTRTNRLSGIGSNIAGHNGVAATGSNNENARPSSPPPNCAICLGRCKNKCFTDSCVHRFCFKCLCEWSKVKAECPLCKQSFRSIIHNVKSNDQYEEYHVQQPTVQIPHSPLEVTYGGNRNFFFNEARRYYNVSMRNISPIPYSLVRTRGPITIRNFMSERDSIPSASVALNASVEMIPMGRNELLNLYRQEYPDDVSNSMSVDQLWRSYIYDRKLYALPVSDVTGVFRECSARFYRDNPAQRIRLIPFANRDIVCLLRNTRHNVSEVLELINGSLENTNILSRSFRRRLQPYLGERTAHFIHELSNFARSPFDMIGYDRTVQYATQSISQENVIEFSSSDEDETNNNSGEQREENTMTSTTARTTALRRAGRQNAHSSSSTTSRGQRDGSEFRVQSRSGASSQTASLHSSPMSLSFTITTTAEGAEVPGVSVAVSAGSRAQVAAINLSTHNRSHNEVVVMNGDSAGAAGTVNGNSSGSNPNNSDDNAVITLSGDSPQTLPRSPPIVASIALTTSSSDECEFVLERKPPHLRTPEMVSLNSESDSDVVFVDESKPILAEATYSTSEPEDQIALSRLLTPGEADTGPSTSKGLRMSTVSQRIPAKRPNSSQQQMEENSSCKKRRLRSRSKRTQPQQNFESDDSSSDNDDSSCDNMWEARARRNNKRNSKRSDNVESSRRRKRRCTNGSIKKKTVKNELESNLDTSPELASTSTQVAGANYTTDTTKTTTYRARRANVEDNPSPRRKSKAEALSSSNKRERHNRNLSSSDATTSDEEEDEKVNLKDLQKRLKTSHSDEEVEANMEQDGYSTSPTYSPLTGYDEISRDVANYGNDNENGNDIEANIQRSAARVVNDEYITSPNNRNSSNSDSNNVTPTQERPSTSTASSMTVTSALHLLQNNFYVHTAQQRKLEPEPAFESGQLFSYSPNSTSQNEIVHHSAIETPQSPERNISSPSSTFLFPYADTQVSRYSDSSNSSSTTTSSFSSTPWSGSSDPGNDNDVNH